MAKRKTKEKKPGRVSEAAPENPDVVDTVVFRSGNSDAVRIPKRFGLLGKTVRIRNEGNTRIVLEVKTKRSWPPGFWEQFKGDFGLRRPPDPPIDPDPRMERLIRRWHGDKE